MYNKVISEKLAEAYEAFSMVRHPLPVSAFMNAAPDSRKAATFFTCMAALSAYSTRLRIKYCYDSYLSGCQLHVFVVGDPSSGKGTLDNIQNMLSSKLLERDMAEREKEQAYENKRKTKSANQRIEEPPVTCVLVLPPSTSKYKICLRASNIHRKYADTLFFYMSTAELGTVLDANRNAFPTFVPSRAWHTIWMPNMVPIMVATGLRVSSTSTCPACFSAPNMPWTTTSTVRLYWTATLAVPLLWIFRKK